jgi:phosphate transport system substrate-binding protein
MLTVSTAAFADMRVHGAVTVARLVIEPNKARLEQAVGEPLAMVVNGSGNGLKDLLAGKAEVAMIAAPLAIEDKILNTLEPGSLDASTLKVFPAGSTKLQFIVNPGNPVTTLTEAQVRDIFTGQVGNWAQVGGSDQPIVVVIEKPLNGTRAVLQASLLQGADYAPQARIAQALGQVTQMVAQLPNAIGYGNAASIEPDKVKVLPGVGAAQPLALVTRGAPTPAQQKLISAVAEVTLAGKQ